jgi:GMC oxidoreductase/NAD(P)-binding Rossmann-like domain
MLLSVIDPDHRMVAHGLGHVAFDARPGIYRAEYRCGAARDTELISIVDRPVTRNDIELAISAPAPVGGTTTTKPEHEACAEEASAALGNASGLVVLVRKVRDGARVTPEEIGRIELLDGAQRVVGTPGWRSGAGGSCLWWSTELPPDGYILRAPHPIARELVTEQPLRISEGWQTLVFARVSRGRAVVTNASIHMAPAGDGWSAEDPDRIRYEAALSELRGGGVLDDETALDIARSAALRRNPMLAIALAHGLGAPPVPEVASFLGDLQELLPLHPDVRIVPWVLAELAGTAEPVDTRLFDWPPMFVAGFRALQRLDALGAGAIRAGTVAEAAASLLVRDGLWTAWDAEGTAAPAEPAESGGFGLPSGTWDAATHRIAYHLDRVAAIEKEASPRELLARDPEQIALATGLASATVAKALTDLEVALPVSGDRPPGQAVGTAEPEGAEPTLPARALLPSERRLHLVSRIGAGLALLAALAWLATLLADSASRAMAVGLVTENLLIGFILAVAAGDVRRFPALIAGVAGILILSGAIGLLAAIDDPGTTVRILGPDVDERAFLIGNGLVQLAVGTALALFGARAQRDRWGLGVLTAGNRRTLAAIADTYAPEASGVSGDEVADHVDSYLARLDAGRQAGLKVALEGVALVPVATLHGTLSLLGAEERRGLLDRLTERATRRRARFGVSPIGLAHQLVALGYHADDRVVRDILGPRLEDDEPTQPAPSRPRLKVEDPKRFDEGTPSADVLVIGSGLTGALLAYRLAEQGRTVLVLERGSHIQAPPEKVETLSDLYRDRGLHVVRHFNDRYVRVMGVGGSCLLSDPEFSMVPEPVIARWNEPDFDAGLDPVRFEQALERVKRLLPGVTMPAGNLNAGACRLLDGLRQLEVPIADGRRSPRDGPAPDELSARSQSVVDTVLPWGQKRFGERLRLVADCRIERILTDDHRATGVRCRLRDGRRLIVPAETVVLAAGAVESSELLDKSKLGGRRVGRDLSATLSAGIVADFPDVLDADRGVQLGVYAGERPDGFVLTTDWEPLPLQAMLMPGWFEEHVANMKRYRYMTSGSALVSVDGRAEVRHGNCRLSPTREDLTRLAKRLALLGRAYLAAGALRIMPIGRSEHAYRDADALEADLPELLELDVLRQVRPQGGNAISADPAKGPVDPSFRVRGTENVYVCDASVFPTAVTVAPNLAALTLAEYAAAEIR